VREGADIKMLPAGLSVFRIGSDGKLEFARKYDLDASMQKQQFWAGMIALS
jgi:6-phosphogluconolactonase